LVFARAPVAGSCKTRLIPALGAAGAARLQRVLTLRIVAAACATGHDVELWCAPDTRHGFFIACRRRFGVRLRRQPAGDLGRRMARALATALADGAQPAVLVGSDCPTLTTTHLRQAVRALATHDAVLQPSPDGGYVLIGARSLEPRALQGIRWSSGRELAQTRRRFARLGLRAAELPAQPDVDTPADHRRARRAGVIPS
jgi:uncharacterized protein